MEGCESEEVGGEEQPSAFEVAPVDGAGEVVSSFEEVVGSDEVYAVYGLGDFGGDDVVKHEGVGVGIE